MTMLPCDESLVHEKKYFLGEEGRMSDMMEVSIKTHILSGAVYTSSTIYKWRNDLSTLPNQKKISCNKSLTHMKSER